jgi:hypothetical protein
MWPAQPSHDREPRRVPRGAAEGRAWQRGRVRDRTHAPISRGTDGSGNNEGGIGDIACFAEHATAIVDGEDDPAGPFCCIGGYRPRDLERAVPDWNEPKVGNAARGIVEAQGVRGGQPARSRNIREAGPTDAHFSTRRPRLRPNSKGGRHSRVRHRGRRQNQHERNQRQGQRNAPLKSPMARHRHPPRTPAFESNRLQPGRVNAQVGHVCSVTDWERQRYERAV